MKKVPAVPTLGRQDIEKHAISLLQKFQPKAYQGHAPADVEAFFEFYLPEHYQIKTGYTDLSFLGHGIFRIY